MVRIDCYREGEGGNATSPLDEEKKKVDIHITLTWTVPPGRPFLYARPGSYSSACDKSILIEAATPFGLHLCKKSYCDVWGQAGSHELKAGL